MDGYIANFDITDRMCCKNCTDTDRRSVSISDLSQTVSLRCNYFLNVIRCTDRFCTVLIQNGIVSIIRNIYTNYDTELCLPTTDKCCEHLLKIGVDITRA